jgi:hypothetical protein
MPDMDEAVNVDLEPEDALRVLLGEERRECEEEPDAETETPGGDEPDASG